MLLFREGRRVVRLGRHEPRVREQALRLRQLDRPLVLGGVHPVVVTRRPSLLKPLLSLAVLLEVARDVHARQTRVSPAIHEVQDPRRGFTPAVRARRGQGLAEERLELRRPLYALAGVGPTPGYRTAVWGLRARVRASRAAVGGPVRRGTLRRVKFPPRGHRCDDTCGMGGKDRALVLVVAGSALLIGRVQPQLGGDPAVVPPVRPRLAQVLRPLVKARWMANHRKKTSEPHGSESSSTPLAQRTHQSGPRLRLAGCLSPSGPRYGESVRACAPLATSCARDAFACGELPASAILFEQPS